jgi:hypothetical protein
MEIPQDKLVDEFPEVPYVGCSGCPRIYQRKKPKTTEEIITEIYA